MVPPLQGSSLRCRQVERLATIAPVLVDALAQAKMVLMAGGSGGGVAQHAMSMSSSVMQTVHAGQTACRSAFCI